MENNSMTAIIILLLLMLAAFFLGWLISRLLGGNGQSNASASLDAEIAEKEAELEACRSNYNSLQAKLSAAHEAARQSAAIATNTLASTQTEPVSADIAVPSTMAAAVVSPAASAAKDDLKIVEGIGPKIEELLNNAGIRTFAELAATSTARLNEILEGAGPRYQMHNPGTWAEQGALCRDGQWNELKQLQDVLKKGKIE